MIRAFTRRMTQPLKNWPHIPFDGLPIAEVGALVVAAFGLGALLVIIGANTL